MPGNISDVATMKILAVSDKIEDSLLQDAVKALDCQEIEAVIACGDLPASYLEYLVSTLNVPLFYVLGNHDQDLYKSILTDVPAWTKQQ